MFHRCKTKINSFFLSFSCVPRYYFIVPVIVLILALAVRLFTGGTHTVYNALDKRGIFPGPVLYMLFYIIRLILSGIVLTFCIFERAVHDERIKTALPAITVTLMLLLEYKFIFGRVSIIAAALFSLLIPICLYAIALSSRIRYRSICIVLVLFAILQIILFIQLISLAVCI